jgi:molybdenum cofactor cytidylyltransferase
MSRRMGQSKMLLPWTKRKTIIEHIIEQLILSRVDHITVVTGYRSDEVGALAEKLGVEVVHNPLYETGEMLSSLKVGLRALSPQAAAALVVLGDQPRLQPRVIGQVLMAYAEGKGEIVAPSYQMRRGHPILIARRYWPELLALPDGGAPRDVINAHPQCIAHVEVDTDSILGDVDTPQDYNQERWRAGLGGANAT